MTRREYSRQWRLAHVEEKREYDRARRATNPEKYRAVSRSWRADNPEKSRGYGREWYKANRELTIQRAREWQAANRERKNTRARQWRVANPERAAATSRRSVTNRSARKRGAFVEHVDPQVVLTRADGICGLCGEPLGADFHVDHIVPLSKGGEHSYANTQAAHPTCNRRKGDRERIDCRGVIEKP